MHILESNHGFLRHKDSGDMSVRPPTGSDNANGSSRITLFGTVALTAVAITNPMPPAPTPAAVAAPPTRPGIDVWQAKGFQPLTGMRVGLITNDTGRTGRDALTVTVLANSAAIELAAIFSPEHGFATVLEGNIDDSFEPTTGLPIYSLYGDTRRPTADMLNGLDGLVFDIQDVGTRFYTYGTTLAYCMEEAARARLPIVVLDRPNPIGGVAVSGPILDESLLTFVGYAPVPIRHGMTIGELARYFNAERGIGAALTVIRAEGWKRNMWYDETGLLWRNPSPNIRNLNQALLYPAIGPLEWTNISVGRGTDAPFEWLGAPWINAQELAAVLNAAALPGIRFIPRHLTPTESVYAGEECAGVELMVIDREAFDTGLTAATLATTLERLHAGAWNRSRLPPLWGDPAIDGQLRSGMNALAVTNSWAPALEEFRHIRNRYLLYD